MMNFNVKFKPTRLANGPGLEGIVKVISENGYQVKGESTTLRLVFCKVHLFSLKCFEFEFVKWRHFVLLLVYVDWILMEFLSLYTLITHAKYKIHLRDSETFKSFGGHLKRNCPPIGKFK